MTTADAGFDAGAARRLVRLAGFAGLAWVLVQILTLLFSDFAIGLQWQTFAVNALPLLLTIAVLRGSLVAALVLGAFGAFRLVSCLIVLTRISQGTASGFYDGLVWETVMVMLFAIIWVTGGVAAVRLLRQSRGSA